MRIFKHPFKKLTLLAIFGGGYVLGAKAGSERYEQIVRTANQVKDDPRVKEATARAEDLARDAATRVTEDPHVKEAAARAQDLARDAVTTVGFTGKSTAGSNESVDRRVDPLPGDDHIGVDDEVVYSSGPDIEESIDELSGTDGSDRV